MNTRNCILFSILSLMTTACSVDSEQDDTKENTAEKSIPRFQSLSIVPNEDVRTSTSLSCLATATDDDGDILEISYQWKDEQGEAIWATLAHCLNGQNKFPTLWCTSSAVTD